MKYPNKVFLLIIILHFIVTNAKANDSLVMNDLLQRIQQLQSKGNRFFQKGMFSGYRFNSLSKDRLKADDNCFFTGLISFTLADIKPQLSVSQQKLADLVIAETLPVFSTFKNRKERNTYNFWPTDTPKIFPNSGLLNLFDKQRALPDDLDDTVISLLALQSSQSTANEIHSLMQSYINDGKGRFNSPLEEYRNIGAYSTWFGKKMPFDIDICVLSNVLFFVQKYDLKWTQADSASLDLIVKVITENKHIRNPNDVSPFYGRLPVILYHISRLMSIKEIPGLEALKPKLIDEAKNALKESTMFMDDVILSTSLLRWGVMPEPKINYSTSTITALIEDESFVFYMGNLATMFPAPIKQLANVMGAGKFYWICPAYNQLLLLENLTWMKKIKQLNKGVN